MTAGPPDPDLARWHADALTGLDHIYRRLTDERLFDPDPGERDRDEPATTMLPAVSASYRYSDPVDDANWPRISAATDDDVPDAFPDGWGAEPTVRDQAAIDAGNA